MKNFKEEIEAMKAQIAALENNINCGCDECSCEDQVVLTNRTVDQLQSMVPVRAYTEEQVIAIAIELVRRTVDVCKEAVTNTNLDDGDFISLELNYNNQIETTLNSDDIVECMLSEIDDYVNVDSDSITDEIGNITGYLNIEC
jgi:hypothetical protein